MHKYADEFSYIIQIEKKSRLWYIIIVRNKPTSTKNRPHKAAFMNSPEQRRDGDTVVQLVSLNRTPHNQTATDTGLISLRDFI